MAQERWISVGATKLTINKSRYTIYIFCLLATAAMLCFLLKKTSEAPVKVSVFTKKNPYFSPLKIERFSAGNIPCLKVRVDNKTVTVKMDLGYEGDICFCPETIAAIDRKNSLSPLLIMD